MARVRSRTYTIVHDTGVRCTFANLEDAAGMTGWEGWQPTSDEKRPTGLDLTGAKTKADLLAYATAMGVDTSAVSDRTTRAEIEALITDRPDLADPEEDQP